MLPGTYASKVLNSYLLSTTGKLRADSKRLDFSTQLRYQGDVFVVLQVLIAIQMKAGTTAEFFLVKCIN